MLSVQGSEFLNKSEEDWPKRKFGNPLEACEEIKAKRCDGVEKLAIPCDEELLCRRANTIRTGSGRPKDLEARSNKVFKVVPGKPKLQTKDWTFINIFSKLGSTIH